MYLKNTSTKVSIVVTTIRGKVGIKPQQIADVKYKILPPVSESLKQVSEDEYLEFVEKTKGIMEMAVQKEEQAPIVIQDEEKLDDLERKEDEIAATEIQDPSIMGFVNSLLGKQPEVKIETPIPALMVNETDSTDEIAELEQQIADLKEKWGSTKAVNKKQKIQKEIQELQKQLKKINK